jgi:hypothetical protein
VGTRRRLERLEERLEPRAGPFEDAVSREVIRRMTTELTAYRDVLKRLIDEGQPSEEDAPILHRRQQLYEEVSGEFAGAQA